MCGIVGMVSKTDVGQDIYNALLILQHRGQDAAGIATWNEMKFQVRKSGGLVRDVFHARHMQRLVGPIGIGHVRYPTAGTLTAAESQPFYVNSPYGIALAHNGNLTNAAELRAELFTRDLRHINTGSDSEILLNVLAGELQRAGKLKPDPEDVFGAVAGIHRRCRGGYAAVAMINGLGLLGFRDPHGIRPAVIGRRGKDTMIASESAALDVLGFTLLRDIAPGEAVFIDPPAVCTAAVRRCAAPGALHFRIRLLRTPGFHCERGVRLPRPPADGREAPRKIRRERPRHGIDVVIPVPDTSRSAALQLASSLGVKYREGFMKNRFMGRTFVMSDPAGRESAVRRKLNPLTMELRGNHVLLVDDSIVRGTTSRQIIQMVRAAGARSVAFASAAPPVRHPNVYGIDMPTASELIAHGRTEKEVEALIGADWLIYQSLEDLVASVAEENPALQDFECSIFDGRYLTGDIDRRYLQKLEKTRTEPDNHHRTFSVSIAARG